MLVVHTDIPFQYRDPDNVDAYTGGLSEPPMNGGILGNTWTITQKHLY